MSRHTLLAGLAALSFASMSGAAFAQATPSVATSGSVSALSCMTEAEVNAGTDIGPKLQTCITNAKNLGKKSVEMPSVSGCYRINTTVDPSDVELYGHDTCVETLAGVDTFRTTSGNAANIHNLRIFHRGPSGSIINLAKGISHRVENNRLSFENNQNPSPVIIFSGSFNFINYNYISNFSPSAYTWIQSRNDCDLISISNQFIGNYMGGPGKGGAIGDNGACPRPEGTIVANNESIVTGGPFLEVGSILSLRVSGNMMDQNNVFGAIRFTPGGFGNYGISGVTMVDNYFSAVGPTQDKWGPNVVVVPGAAGMDGLVMTGNFFAFGTHAADLDGNLSNVTFGANYMGGGLDDHCIQVRNPAILTNNFDGGSAKQCPNKSHIYVPSTGARGTQKATRTSTYDTNTGGGYTLIPHGIAGTPTSCAVNALSKSGDTARAVAWRTLPVQFDNTNVVISVQPDTLITNGTVTLTMTCEL